MTLQQAATFELGLEGRRICQVEKWQVVKKEKKKKVPPGALSSKCKEARELG